MYTAFYKLSKKPFNMTADPSFLFVTKQHREALVGLTYAVLDRKGLLVLSGMAGSGKTTLLAWLLQRLPGEDVRTSVILNPMLTPDEFLESVLLDFGIIDVPASKAQRLWKLQNFLVAGVRDRKVNVLIVDEAHKLSYDVLEEIRLLGNLECGDEKMLQILLLGQSELDEMLARPDLWQVKQRVSVRLSIGSLAANEVEPYIQYRWSVAGGLTHPFTPTALDHVRRWSRGIPRLINAICDTSLTEAFADASASVTEKHVDAAASDLRLMDKPAAGHDAKRAVAASAAAPARVAAPAMATAPAKPMKREAVAAPAMATAAVKPIKAEPHNPVRRSLFFRWAVKLGFNGHGGR
jgi:general secretion pathway protein A